MRTVLAGSRIGSHTRTWRDAPTGAILNDEILKSIRAGQDNNGNNVANIEGGVSPWLFAGNNETVVYRGEFFDADGIFAFAENIDDDVVLRIDGNEVIRDAQWNVPRSSWTNEGGNTAAGAGTTNFGMGPNNDGWHEIEILMSNGGGGAGPVGGNGWEGNYGFGVNINPSFTGNGTGAGQARNGDSYGDGTNI